MGPRPERATACDSESMVMGITVLDNICSHVFHVGLHIGTPVPF